MIKCTILTPEGLYKTLETPSLLVGTIDGERGLLEHHMPIVLILDISKIVTYENNIKNIYASSGGVLCFENGCAKIMVNSIENVKDIDYERAIKAKERSDGYLKSKDPNIDIKRAEIALKKALNRINLYSMK